MTYTVGIIGTGPDPEVRDRHGFAMGYRHAAAYDQLANCSVVACADLVQAHADAFAEHHGLPATAAFDDHEEMLRSVEPDIVSVCVPPAVHANIVINCASAPGVKAIHCEKPMATNWGDCRAMVEACESAGVQLTIDHQRRFAIPVIRAKKLLSDGAIGELKRLEWTEVNLFDAGTHLFDLCDYLVDGESAEWMLAGVDIAEENRWFGTLNCTQAVAHWAYANGVQGFASTGEGDRQTLVDAYLRLVGTEGVIEIQPEDGPPLRVRTNGGWKTVDTDGERLYGPIPTIRRSAKHRLVNAIPGLESSDSSRPNYARAISHVVESLEENAEPIISGHTALRGTELIFSAWESTRRGGRVELPLDVEDNPLESIFSKAEPTMPSV